MSMKKATGLGIAAGALACGVILNSSTAAAASRIGFFVSDMDTLTNSGCGVKDTTVQLINNLMLDNGATHPEILANGPPVPILATELNNCLNNDESYSAVAAWSNYLVYGTGQWNPIWPVPGNHDYYDARFGKTSAPDAFLRYFGVKREINGIPAVYDEHHTYGVVPDLTKGDWLVLGLNSELEDGVTSESMSDQVNWLREKLATRPRCVLAFFHRPIYSNAVKHATDGGRLASALATELKNAHVDLVFSGHEHVYERFYPDSYGLTQVVAGTGGALRDTSFKENPSNPSFAARDNSGALTSNNEVIGGGANYGVLKFKLHDQDDEGPARWEFEYFTDRLDQSGGTYHDGGSAECNSYQ